MYSTIAILIFMCFKIETLSLEGYGASVNTKEYLLVIEGSVPPIVVKRKHSPNLSPLCLQHLIIPVRLYNCRQSRQREVG